MINFLIAYDDIDVAVRDYLVACYSNLQQILDTVDDKRTLTISGNQCTSVEVEINIDKFEGEKFFFVAYTHGNASSLVVSHVPYVSNENVRKFQNSFFYTCACLSAISLGPELERHGCLAYIGYDQEVKMPLNNLDVFKKCKNSGIEFFLGGNRTLLETYKHMIATYENEYEKLGNQEDNSFLSAAFLRSNMNALVYLGRNDLTLNDFLY